MTAPPAKCEACKGRGLDRENKSCPRCDGYGFMMGERAMSQQVKEAPKKRPPYYPERFMNCSEGTLLEWKGQLEKEIRKFEAQAEERRGGLDQIDEELEKRIAARKAKGA